MTITEVLDTMTPRQMRDALTFLSGYSERGFAIAYEVATNETAPVIEDTHTELV